MSPEENVATVRRLVEAINTNDLARVAPDLYQPGSVRHDLSGARPGVRGASGVVNFIAEAHIAMPDVQFQIDDVFGAGDRVALRFTMRGTHRGELLGRPPTGEEVTMCCMNIYRLEDGKIAESWQLFDYFGLMHQLDAAGLA
jgi:predicted ester cyclase